MHTRARSLFVALTLAGLGCGARQSARPATNDDFHEIQRLEARIAELAENAGNPPEPGTLSDERTTGICAAAEDLCALASELDDRDARTRCDRARATCARVMAERGSTLSEESHDD